MNIEKQKQIIAPLAGYRLESLLENRFELYDPSGELIARGSLEWCWKCCTYNPHDENEIRRVWRGLDATTKMLAFDALLSVLGIKETKNEGFKEWDMEAILDAKAPQLCQALVTALGKWEGEK